MREYGRIMSRKFTKSEYRNLRHISRYFLPHALRLRLLRRCGQFKVEIRVQWEAWMTSGEKSFTKTGRGEKSFTKTGRMRRATFSQVCQWILTAWSSVKESTITNGFLKAGLLRGLAVYTGSRSSAKAPR